MNRQTSSVIRRRWQLIVPLLLLTLLAWRVVDSPDHATVPPRHSPALPLRTDELSSSEKADRAEAVPPAAAPVKPTAEGAAWAALESDGFTPRTRELAAALDAGSALLVRAPDGAVREFVIRPRRLLGDDFQITIGEDRGSTFAAGVRSYEGRTAGARIAAAIAGGAFAAEIEEADGATTYLLTDETTGGLRTLRRTREQKRFTCEHDPVTGIASTKSDQPPVTEEDWKRAPEVTIEPVTQASSGFDPGTGRLDKYVQPLAWGHNYEISLRDNLAIVTLDKLVTGVQTMARLSQITSEYLAKSANLASIQENNLGVRYLVQELILTPDNGSYADVPVSLGDYGWWISQRRPRGTYGWDLSTRFGNGGFSGGTIGVAWVRSLGTTSPVNTCQKGYNVELEAHEQGHNMGSDHSNGGIMGSGAQINAGIPGTRDFFTDVFAGETSAMQIWNHASSRLTGSAAMRHAEQLAWAMDDSVNTPAGQPVEILPLANDRRFVRNGLNNAVLRVEEVSRVHPIHAGSAEVIAPDRIRFTPSAGYEGQAWFSYSLRGSVGNGGAGWLHKGDIAVGVGTWDRNNLNLRLAPGQEFSFRPSSGTDTTIVSQPLHARVDTARDDRHLIIIRVLATATGTDSFDIQRDGVNSTVNITYVTDFLQTQPDTFTMQPGQAAIRFSPMANDQGAGCRNMADVKPLLGEPTANKQGQSYFPGAFRFTGATLATPAKGTIALSQRLFTLNSVATPTYSGQVTFTPAANARGVARINYTVQDAAGTTQSNTATIILPLGEITSPATTRAVIAPRHGLVLDAVTWPTAEAPLTGTITSLWAVEAAPAGASVVFDNAAAARTGASFSHAGTYTLRLTLTDSGFITADEVTVIVEPSATGATDSLIAWWKLDEAAGSTQALDASGTARHGALLNGIARTAGIVGSGSLTCDGTDDFVELSAHVSAVQNLAQGTISLWFKTNTASLRPIFSMSDNRDQGRYLRVYLENGILKYKVLGDLGTDIASLASPGTSNDDLWHHAAVTVDASRNARLYLDGTLVREGLRPFCNAVFNLSSMAIGRTVRSNGTDYWRGGVDDVRVYSRPLTADEVLSLARLSENRGPLITLGAGPVISGSRTINTAILNPSVTDDGRPLAAFTRTWTALPGTVNFGTPTAATTSMTAPADGTWKLRLEASDGGLRTWRETPVTFTGNDPGAPWCSGLTAVRVPLSAPPAMVNLFAAFGDPDGPDEALTFTVTANTNPALFSSVTVSATAPRQLVLGFPPATPGSAALTIRATDAGGAFVEGTLPVTVENFAPFVPSAGFSVSENAPAGTVAGTIFATDPEGTALRYTITGGNALDAFALHPDTGVLSVATPFALDYENRPLFALTVRVSEAAQPASFAEATVLVSLANENEPPAFAPQNFTLRTGSPNGTAAGTLSAGDPEGHALTFAITGGNTGGAFSITAGNNLIVANAAALDILTSPRFTLTITATDDAMPPAVSTATVRITLEGALISQGSALRWRVPAAAPADGYAWIQRNYHDTAWQTGTSGIGYDTGADYQSLLGTTVQSAMYNLQPSLFIRIPFTAPEVNRIGRLTLRMKYEDGYWAWINGTAPTHHGAPDPAAWNSAATGIRDENEAVTFRDEDLTFAITALIAGSNTLAIQGINESAASSDLLILPELVWSAAGTSSVPDVPAVTTRDVTFGQTVVLNGELVTTGGAPLVNITAWLGRVDGGTSPAGWEHRIALPDMSFAAPFSYNVTAALRPSTEYYFRFSASHSGGEAWSGSLTFFSEPASGAADYTSWAAAFPGLTGALAAPDYDADADGLTNFMEYGVGGNPTLTNDAALIGPVIAFTKNGGEPAFDVTFRRRLDRIVRGLSYQVELSPALTGTWIPVTGATLSGPLPTGDGVTEQLTGRFVLPTGGPHWFVRLRVTHAE